MDVLTAEQLAEKKCLPCEGGVEPFSPAESDAQLARLDGWHLTHEGRRIRKDWVLKNFAAGIALINDVAGIAEDDGHHPDIHLEGYRNVSIELWTHAIGGLSENDFILAAKIDRLSPALRRKPLR